jgi:DNA-binding winged helix-turn-helix (wHTH) protein/TolB-like protein
MIYTFGTFVFDTDALDLRRDGRIVRLEPQPARALALLLARAGEVVTRAELRAAIWDRDTHVDYERGMAYCLSQVRTALGDSSDNPRFVQTLPKRGFRFLAPVARSGPAGAPAAGPTDAGGPAEGTAPPAEPVHAGGVRRAPIAGRVWMAAAVVAAALVGGWWIMADTTPALTTIGVAIFDNETGDPQFDGFVTGLSDLVVSRLAEIAPGRVGVIGNAAPLRQPRAIRTLSGIAASIPAEYVVMGQLQREEAGLRFVLHFIRLRDNVHYSARRLTRPSLDIAGLGDDVVAEADRTVRANVPALSEPSASTATR